MSNVLSLFGGVKETMWQIAILVAVVALIIALIKFPNARVYVFSILGIVLIGLSSYCGIMLHSYYATHGGVFGKIQEFINPTQIKVIDELNFEFAGIEMRAVSDEKYRATISTTDLVELPAGSSYVLLVNGLPCNTRYDETSSDFLIANYVYTFMDENKQEIITDTLTIRIAFNVLNTSVSVETNGGSDCAKLWNSFFNKNGFKITLTTDKYVEKGELSFGTGDVSNYVLVKFKNREEEFTQVALKNSKLSLPKINDERFVGWSYNGTIIDENFIVNEEIELTAKFIRATELSISCPDLISVEYEGVSYSSTKSGMGHYLTMNVEDAGTLTLHTASYDLESKDMTSDGSISYQRVDWNGNYTITWSESTTISISLNQQVSYT